jgi:hypothetical protein
MTLEYKGNVAPPEATEEVKGLWNVYEVDGVSSLQEHELKTIWQSCEPGACYFEITNSPKREATCKHCGRIVTFIVGIDILKDGKFTTHPIK